MRKSSIFSREYEKKIRRRRFAILFIILVLSVMIVYYIINFSQFNSYVRNVYYSVISKNNMSVSTQQEDESDLSVSHDFEQNESAEIVINEDVGLDNEYLVYEVDLEEDNKVHILYYNDNGIKYLDSQNRLPDNYRFDISPNKNRILIEQVDTQNVYMLDENLNLFRLDPEFFYSNSAKTSFYKDDVLSKYNGYLWYKNSRFLDNDTIVYVSNLPWFGSDEHYIWRTDVSDTDGIKHFMTGVGGQNIDFGELTEQGIKVNINNEMKLLTFSFILN